MSELLSAANAKDSPVDLVFMVGGFSESPYLKTEIKNKFEKGGL